MSGPQFPQLKDEYVLAFLHKDALTGLAASSWGFKYKVLSEGQSQLEFAAVMKDERADLGWRVPELGLFLPLSPYKIGVVSSSTSHAEMSQYSPWLAAAPLLPPGHPLGCPPSLHRHSEMLRDSRNKDALSQFARIQV